MAAITENKIKEDVQKKKLRAIYFSKAPMDLGVS